jgi:hypothetical protein
VAGNPLSVGQQLHEFNDERVLLLEEGEHQQGRFVLAETLKEIIEQIVVLLLQFIA